MAKELIEANEKEELQIFLRHLQACEMLFDGITANIWPKVHQACKTFPFRRPTFLTQGRFRKSLAYAYFRTFICFFHLFNLNFVFCVPFFREELNEIDSPRWVRAAWTPSYGGG
jgi:hypothetical protein